MSETKRLPKHVVHTVEGDGLVKHLVVRLSHLLASVPLHDKVLQAVRITTLTENRTHITHRKQYAYHT